MDRMRTKALAEAIGVDPATVRRWMRIGAGPRGLRTPGGQWIFEKADVDRWLAGLRRSEGPVELPTGADAGEQG